MVEHSPSPTHLSKLDGLTTLRFIAALYVFLFHFDTRISAGLSQFVKNIVSNGAIAMPVFFMLSGFVLGYRYHRAYPGFAAYYKSRVARIMPAYLFCAFVSLPLLAYFGSLNDAHYWLGLVFIFIISVLLLQAWYPNLFDFWHFGGTWSISVEMFLYACLPILRRLSHYSTHILFGVALSCLLFSASLLPSLRLSISESQPFPVFYAIPVYHVPDFVIGFVLSQLFIRHGGDRRLTLAFPALILFLGLFSHLNWRYMTLSIVILPMVALTIYGFASLTQDRAAVFDRFLQNRLFVYLGDISYSFFLLQIPVMVWLDHNKQAVQHIPQIQLFIYTLGITLLLAMFSYHFVERKGREMILAFAYKPSWQTR